MNWWQADQQRAGTSDGLMAAVQTGTGLLLIVTALVQILDWLLHRYVRIAFHAASTAVQMAGADLV
jgi:hypothetical protein